MKIEDLSEEDRKQFFEDGTEHGFLNAMDEWGIDTDEIFIKTE